MTAADLLFVVMAVAAVVLTGFGFATEFKFWDAKQPMEKRDEQR